MLLAALSLAACFSEVVIASTGLMGNHVLAIANCLVLGAAVSGWNGVLLSDVADAAPPDKVASATAGCFFFSFGGVMTFPAMFGVLERVSGGYVVSWFIVAMANAPLGVMLLAVTKSQAPELSVPKGSL